jgi:hypothetical protein
MYFLDDVTLHFFSKLKTAIFFFFSKHEKNEAKVFVNFNREIAIRSIGKEGKDETKLQHDWNPVKRNTQEIGASAKVSLKSPLVYSVIYRTTRPGVLNASCLDSFQ